MLKKRWLLEKAKKNIAVKESVLANKKGELEKIIAANEKEEKHFNKLAAEAKTHVDTRLLASYEKIRKSYRNGLAVVACRKRCLWRLFQCYSPAKAK